MKEQLTAAILAKKINATLEGNGDLLCTGVAAIAEAVQGDVTFMISNKYASQWESSGASIGIVPKGIKVKGHDESTRAILRVEDAELAIAEVLELFATPIELPEVGIHPTAVISASATIGEHVSIGPHVVISDHASIGESAILCSSVHIGHDVSIGARTMLRTSVVVEHGCTIGEDTVLHAHVVIGSDGFGFRPNATMTGLTKMPHVGTVVIGDRVEIGANACIDRGKFSSTSIGSGTKMDNLVQVGHNVKIGENCVIASLCGIGGSVNIGSWVQLGAQVGIAPHCKVGDGAKLGAKSGLMHDIPAGEEWLGVPAGKMKDTLRQWAITRKMPKLAKQISGLIDD